MKTTIINRYDDYLKDNAPYLLKFYRSDHLINKSGEQHPENNQKSVNFDSSEDRYNTLGPAIGAKFGHSQKKGMRKAIPLEEGDYYLSEEGYKVFTEQYHLKRGHCCESGCRHCPYGFDRKTGLRQ